MQQFHKIVLEDQSINGDPTIASKDKMTIGVLDNEIVEAEYKSQHILTIVL